MPRKPRLTKKELQSIKDLVTGKKSPLGRRTRFIKQELNAIKDMVTGKKPTKPKPRPKPKRSKKRKLNA